MGVMHYTVELEGNEKGDGRNGTPIGLNKDPLNVFSVQMAGQQPVLKITGEIYAGLSTRKEYENYHLSLMFKWGEKKYEPRLQDKRDSGILYHCQEPHGQWNHLELLCIGGKAYHIVNGKVVMVLEDSSEYHEGKKLPLTKGKIQIQSEAAEIYYKEIKIRNVSELPEAFAAQVD